jgi:DNA-binding NarL/FixJ family response regulator
MEAPELRAMPMARIQRGTQTRPGLPAAPLRVVVAGEGGTPPDAWLLELASIPDLRIVARSHDAASLLKMLRVADCDAVVLGLGPRPTTPGLGVLRLLLRLRSHPPVVVVADDDDEALLDRVLSLGPVGYVLAVSPPSEVLTAVAWAAAGGVWVHPHLARTFLEHRVAGTPRQGVATHVSPRQLDLLRAIADGRTNKEIAHDLSLSSATVNDYMKQLFQRLGVASRAAAVSEALRRGIIG